MTAADHADGTETLGPALRRGLIAALKARDSEAVSALRTAIAALDNAEAVPDPGIKRAPGSARIAGATSGAGSSEAVRRRLSPSELDAIVREQVTEQEREAERYDALGQVEAAGRLRRQAQILVAYLR
jgi:uncharacterized protein YqeY